MKTFILTASGAGDIAGGCQYEGLVMYTFYELPLQVLFSKPGSLTQELMKR
jgi:hypothetical protein